MSASSITSCICNILPPPPHTHTHTHTHAVTNIGLGLSIYSSRDSRFGNLTIFWVYLGFVVFFIVMVGVLLVVFSILSFSSDKAGQHFTSVFVLFLLQSHSQFHSVYCPIPIPVFCPVSIPCIVPFSLSA